MQKPIVHDTLFSLLGLEIDKSPEGIQAILRRDPGEIRGITDLLEQTNFHELGITLAEPLRDGRDGAPLLAANVTLTPRYVKSLLTRQLQHQEVTIGPIAIAPTEAAIDHYKKKITKKFSSMVAEISNSQDSNTKIIYDVINTWKSLQELHICFDEILDHFFSSSESIRFFLTALSKSTSPSIFKKSINAAFISMAILSLYQEYPQAEERKKQLKTIGLAGLMQDMSSLVTIESDDASHPESSAAIAEEIGVDEAVAGLIRIHHTVTDSKGRPALIDPSLLSPSGRVLVTTNVFVSMAEGEAQGKNFATMKQMNYLAKGKYIDEKSVRILCRMFLPKVKAYLIEKANKIATECLRDPMKPTLWPITGDKVPSLFLCREFECEYKTDQMSHIARPIPVVVDGIQVSTIEKGDYHTCPLLTKKLKALYEMIRENINKDA